AVTLLIGACYVAGAWELLRYRQATATLSHAVAGLTEPPAKLDPWLDTLHPGLRGAVRARVEGAHRAAQARMQRVEPRVELRGRLGQAGDRVRQRGGRLPVAQQFPCAGDVARADQQRDG
ncbi:hypothetical protein, partial [Burkholderia cenocepacia]|uniref:hypothetical protein n=1 Tax=Burkholderia cenocepacia TaxID=95486 RepID=UPI0024B856D4